MSQTDLQVVEKGQGQQILAQIEQLEILFLPM